MNARIHLGTLLGLVTYVCCQSVPAETLKILLPIANESSQMITRHSKSEEAVIRDMFAKSRISVEFTYFPAARAVLQSQHSSDGNVCVAYVAKIPENVSKYSFSDAVGKTEVWLWSKTDEHGSIGSLADLSEATIGVTNGYAVAKELARNGIRVDLGQDDASVIKKLLAGRYTFIAMAEEDVLAIESETGSLPIKKVYLLPFQGEYYFGCSLKIEQSLMREINHAIHAYHDRQRH